MVLDDNGLSNWIDHLPFNPFFQVNNVTELITSTPINPPIRGMIDFIIIAINSLTYNSIIEIGYLDYLTNWGV